MFLKFRKTLIVNKIKKNINEYIKILEVNHILMERLGKIDESFSSKIMMEINRQEELLTHMRRGSFSLSLGELKKFKEDTINNKKVIKEVQNSLKDQLKNYRIKEGNVVSLEDYKK